MSRALTYVATVDIHRDKYTETDLGPEVDTETDLGVIPPEVVY